MNYQEFNHQLDRLRDVYGDKSYSDQRTKLLWARINDLSAAWFACLVDGFIETSRQSPMISDFKDAVSNERNRLYKKKKESSFVDENKNYDCNSCGDSGFRFKTIDGCEFTYRCCCTNGNIRNYLQPLPA
jgi:hypothetical protein